MAVATLRLGDLRQFCAQASAIGADFVIWSPPSGQWHAVGGAKGVAQDVLSRTVATASTANLPSGLLFVTKTLAKHVPADADHEAELNVRPMHADILAVDFVLPRLERHVAFTVNAVAADAELVKHLASPREEVAAYAIPALLLHGAGALVSALWRHGEDVSMRGETIETHLSPGLLTVRSPRGDADVSWAERGTGPTVRLWVRAMRCLGAMAALHGARVEVVGQGRVIARAAGTRGEFGSAGRRQIALEPMTGEGREIRRVALSRELLHALDARASAHPRMRARVEPAGIFFTRESSGIGTANPGCVVISSEIVATLRMAMQMGEGAITRICIDSTSLKAESAGVLGRCRVTLHAS